MNWSTLGAVVRTRAAVALTLASVLFAFGGEVRADASLDPATALISDGVHVYDPDFAGERPVITVRSDDSAKRDAIARHHQVVDESDMPQPGYFLTKPIVIGVQSSFGIIGHGDVYRTTIEQLRRFFGSGNVVVKTMTKNDLQSAVTGNKVDFVIADAGFYTQYETVAGLKSIASLWPITASDPGEAMGALYISKKDNREVSKVEDIVGKKLAAYYPGSFEGYLVAERDLKKRGLLYDSQMRQVDFYGDNPRAVIQAVLDGRSDIGVLPACTMERMIVDERVDRSEFRYLGLRADNSIQCMHSTDLYPSYYFAATPDADTQIMKAVSTILFTMDTMADGIDWSLPASNRAVHDLFFDLKIGPYAHLGRWSFERFVKEQAKTATIVGFISFLIISYALSLQVLVRRRTKMLRQALADRSRIEKLANASRDHIANLERTGIVGQMSTMIAHELKQPLGAITNFANGLLRRSKRGQIDPKLLTEVLEEIVEQGTRASEIVNRVRSYAKHQNPQLKMSDMSITVERAIETFKRSRRTDANINMLVPPYLWADIDGWELELAVLNLLKNAGDALQGTEDAAICVRVFAWDRYWRIEVSDNGPRITQADVDRFMMPLVTSKVNGMGLGISIVANIAERHHGRLIGKANDSRGVTIFLDIPRAVLPEHTAM